jgi:hypothetical protein
MTAEPKRCAKCGGMRGGRTCLSCGHEEKRGGRGRGQGGKRKTAATFVPESLDGRTNYGKAHAAWLIEQLNADYDPQEALEVAGWRRFWDSPNQAIALECRRYLYDKAGHKAMQIINHLHEKQIDQGAKTLSDRFREAMKKGEERVRSGNPTVN